MVRRLRAPFAAAVALLIGGDLAVYAASTPLDVWSWVQRWLFPYLWLFLLFEALRARRRLLDAEAFLLGAAAGLLHDGVYAKSLQEGALPFGVDVLGAAVAAFDWGLIVVAALHATDAVFARGEEESPDESPELWRWAAIAALSAWAAASYLLQTVTGRYRYERMLGSSWLLADLLFAGAAWALAWRALRRAREEEPAERDRWLWWLAAFCAWLPGAQGLARAGAAWPGPLVAFFVSVWTACVGWGVWRLWVERGRVDEEPRRADPAVLGLAAWRLLGMILVGRIFGAPSDDGRTAGAFQLLVDLPTRLIFLYVFFARRLRV